MDLFDTLYLELFIAVLWCFFVFAPISILIFGKSKNKFLYVASAIRLFIEVVLFYLVSDDSILVWDFFLLVILGLIFFIISRFSSNYELYMLYERGNKDWSKYKTNNRVVKKDEIKPKVISEDEIKPKAISKDERKIKVIRSRVISNQKEYVKDNYNLGGAENNGANSGGEYSNRVTISNHSNEGVYMNREADTTAKEICTYCGEKVKSDFIYCPACGKPIVSKMIQDTDGFK